MGGGLKCQRVSTSHHKRGSDLHIGKIAFWSYAVNEVLNQSAHLHMAHDQGLRCLDYADYVLGLHVRKPVFGDCEQQRRKPACAYVQSDQHHFYSLIGKYHIETCYKQTFNFLIEDTGSSLALSETLKTGFNLLRRNPIVHSPSENLAGMLKQEF